MKNIISVNKPIGPTSNDVVQQVKKITGVKRVGHAGTLDPLASGVLVVGVGREATRQLSTVVQKEKEYIAMVRLGEYSTTDDQEGDKEEIEINSIPSENEVLQAIKHFCGNIKQTPPIYSAVNIKGRVAYKYARKGQKVEIKPRTVKIEQIELLSYRWPDLKLRVVTGPGVYIRSLARDIGKTLEVGGYLKSLERTRVGNYTLADSFNIDKLKKSNVNDTN